MCVFTGKRREDTSLSVVLMVPLTTQQWPHIVLAVGLKHVPERHTNGLAHAHTEIGCHDKRSRLVSAPFLPHSPVPALFLRRQNLHVVHSDQHTHTRTHPAVHTQHLRLSPSRRLLRVCLRVSCQSSITRPLIELSTSGPCCVEGTPTQTSHLRSSYPFLFSSHLFTSAFTRHSFTSVRVRMRACVCECVYTWCEQGI